MQTSAAIDSARAVVAAHDSWTTWGMIAVILLEAVVIISLVKHHGGWDFIATLPTTNLRILVGIGLFSFANIVLIVSGYATRIWPPVDVILALEGALLINLGLDVTQYGVKRKTEDPDVIAANAAAAGCTPSPAPPTTGPTTTVVVGASKQPAIPAAPTNAAQALAGWASSVGD